MGGDERGVRPGGATRAGTQAPPLHLHHIFPRIPHKQNETSAKLLLYFAFLKSFSYLYRMK